MKKRIAVLLVVVMTGLLLLPLQASAQYDKELEKAITTAKTLFNISDAYDQFNYQINNYDNKTQFYLSWNDTKNKLGNVSVTIDTSGRVTNYYTYKPYYGKAPRKLPAISKNDGYLAAVKFIEKVDPAIAGRLKYYEETGPINFGSTEYNYRFSRIENGVVYPDNQVNVSVDNLTNEVRGFYMNWTDDAVFPGTDGMMTLQQAEQLFPEKLGLKLVYRLKYDDNKRTPYLVYTSVLSNQYLDAKTGEIVNANTYYAYAGNDMAMVKKEMAAGAAMPVTLTPQEQDAVESAAGIMNADEAEKAAREEINMDADYLLRNINLYRNWQNENDYSWNMYFEKKVQGESGSEYYSFNVSLDAKTGEVLSFNNNLPYQKDAAVQYDEAQSLKIAQDWIQARYPEKYDQVEYADWQIRPIVPLKEADQPRQYYFNLIRKTNGAYFLDNGFNITVDTTTGQVISMNLNWYKGDLPSTDSVIGLDRAHQVMVETIGLESLYVGVPAEEPAVPAEEPAAPGEKILPRPVPQSVNIKLVYGVKNDKPLNIDAYTGNLLDYTGETYQKPEIAQYSDIQGNFAENQIKVLAEFGISLPGGRFTPNATITQKDFLILLNKAVNPYSMINFDDEKAEDELYNGLINSGIIKEAEKNPQGQVTREDAVKFVIRALNYDKVADIQGIFTLPFKDAGQIKPDLYGYVAIAYGLKLVQGNDGLFNPLGSLTRAQAAVIIYNYLNL